jgi:LysM repeat protein
MRALRELGGGIIIAIVSLILVIGGISLALLENPRTEQPEPLQSSPIPATSIEIPTFTPSLVNTIDPSTSTETPTTLAPSATQTLPLVCNPPAGWIQIVMGVNDTLYTIAERYKTTTDILSASNCLTTIPGPGSLLFVPPVPTVTVIPCGAPAGWIQIYRVQPGDNLYRISLLYRTTISQLQFANCMGASTTIYAGQMLWVPNVPTSTPGITVIPNTATPSSTPTATNTYTPEPPDISTPTDTSTPTSTPSQ